MKNNQIKSLRNWSCGSALVPVLKSELLKFKNIDSYLAENQPELNYVDTDSDLTEAFEDMYVPIVRAYIRKNYWE